MEMLTPRGTAQPQQPMQQPVQQPAVENPSDDLPF